MEKYVIAVVGCGRISKTHMKGLAELGNVRVKYACDLIESKAQDAKNTHPDMVETAITDYKVALADPEVETVFVLTPNYAHYTISVEALRAGKHVMCEKPITVNYELSLEMAKAADESGKLLNIGVCNRYRKGVVEIENLVREGKLGNIYHVVCDYRAFRSIPGLGGDFTTKSIAGGGVLFDWGVHYLDLILYILGGPKIKNVTCDAYNKMAADMKSYKYTSMWAEDTKNVESGTNDVDDFVAGYIRTDAANISFSGAWAQNVDDIKCFVDFLGEKGGARFYYADGSVLLTDGETLESRRITYENENTYHKAEDEAFLAATRKGEITRSNVKYVLDTMKLLDALYKSAELGHEITLD